MNDMTFTDTTCTQGGVTIELAGADADLVILWDSGTEVLTIMDLCRRFETWHGEPDDDRYRVQVIYVRDGRSLTRVWLSTPRVAGNRVRVTVSYEPDGKGIVAQGWYDVP